MKPSFVYFDLGGVVILDFSKTNKWKSLKEELGITADRLPRFDEIWSTFGKEVCKGRNVEDIKPIFKTEFHIDLPLNYSVLVDGFINRFEKNPSLWPVIEYVRKFSRVGLFTNVYTDMLPIIQNKLIPPELIWDVVIDSSLVKLAKPDPAIYTLAETLANVKGEKILFIENSPENIATAQNFGWQTFLYDPKYPEKSSQELLKAYRALHE